MVISCSEYPTLRKDILWLSPQQHVAIGFLFQTKIARVYAKRLNVLSNRICKIIRSFEGYLYCLLDDGKMTPGSVPQPVFDACKNTIHSVNPTLPTAIIQSFQWSPNFNHNRSNGRKINSSFEFAPSVDLFFKRWSFDGFFRRRDRNTNFERAPSKVRKTTATQISVCNFSLVGPVFKNLFKPVGVNLGQNTW